MTVHCDGPRCVARLKPAYQGSRGACPCGCPPCDEIAGDVRPWHGPYPKDLADAVRRIPGLIRIVVLTPNLGEEP